MQWHCMFLKVELHNIWLKIWLILPFSFINSTSKPLHGLQVEDQYVPRDYKSLQLYKMLPPIPHIPDTEGFEPSSRPRRPKPVEIRSLCSKEPLSLLTVWPTVTPRLYTLRRDWREIVCPSVTSTPHNAVRKNDAGHWNWHSCWYTQPPRRK